jgi:hypothetical protein
MLDASLPIEQQIENMSYRPALYFLRKNGYNFTCTIKRDSNPGFVYSKGDHHIPMSLEVTDDVRIKVLPVLRTK